MEAELLNLLKSTLSTVGGLEGNVYPIAAPENAGRVHCVYTLSKKEDILALDRPTGLSWYTIILFVAAARYAELLALCEAVKKAVVDLPRTSDSILDLQWEEPNAEDYASQWGVLVRAPVIKILYQS